MKRVVPPTRCSQSRTAGAVHAGPLADRPKRRRPALDEQLGQPRQAVGAAQSAGDVETQALAGGPHPRGRGSAPGAPRRGGRRRRRRTRRGTAARPAAAPASRPRASGGPVGGASRGPASLPAASAARPAWGSPASPPGAAGPGCDGNRNGRSGGAARRCARSAPAHPGTAGARSAGSPAPGRCPGRPAAPTPRPGPCGRMSPGAAWPGAEGSRGAVPPHRVGPRLIGPHPLPPTVRALPFFQPLGRVDPQPPVLPPPAVIRWRGHAEAARDRRDRFPRREHPLRLPQVAADRLGRVPLACHADSLRTGPNPRTGSGPVLGGQVRATPLS